MVASAPDGQNPFRVLSDSQYRLLFLGTTLSMLAFGMMQVVQQAVAFHLTGKNGAVGFVVLGQGIAMLFLSPLGGTLSDRVSKKRLLTAAQFVIGLMFGTVAVLIALDMITLLLLAAGSLILGCMFSMMGPTRQAWVGDILDGPQLASGVALQQLAMNATRIVGPLLAGLLIGIGAIGTSGTYFTMAGLFAAVVAVLALMKPTPPRPRSTRTSVRTDVTEGFRYIWRTHDVRLLAFVFVGVVLVGFSYQTLMVGYLENALGRPSSSLGLLFGANAVGGILVTLILAARPVQNGPFVMLAFGAILAISVSLLGIAPTFVSALAVSAVIGVSSSGFQMLNNVNLMERTEPLYFGRVMSVTMMAFGVNSIFAYPVGLIADAAGERATLVGLGCVCGVVVILGSFALRSLRRARVSIPVVAVEVTAASSGG